MHRYLLCIPIERAALPEPLRSVTPHPLVPELYGGLPIHVKLFVTAPRRLKPWNATKEKNRVLKKAQSFRIKITNIKRVRITTNPNRYDLVLEIHPDVALVELRTALQERFQHRVESSWQAQAMVSGDLSFKEACLVRSELKKRFKPFFVQTRVSLYEDVGGNLHRVWSVSHLRR